MKYQIFDQEFNKIFKWFKNESAPNLLRLSLDDKSIIDLVKPSGMAGYKNECGICAILNMSKIFCRFLDPLEMKCSAWQDINIRMK